MSTEIKRLYDKSSGNIVFPKTHERAVIDNNGTTLESKLQDYAPADNEDIGVLGGALKLKNKTYDTTEYSGYGRKILRKNVITEDVRHIVGKTPIQVIYKKTVEGEEVIDTDVCHSYMIDLENYTLDYTDSNNWYTFRCVGTDFDVEAGEVFEFRASSMTNAVGPDYVNWRMWVLVDPLTKEILKDDDGNYIMAEAGVNYESEPIQVFIPKSGRLCVSCWTGQTSAGYHEVSKINFSSEQKPLNVLEQNMLTDTNTIYIVQYDYDINGRTITIPENSILQFDGGSIKSSGLTGTLVGENTCINAPIIDIFGSNVVLSGDWLDTEFHVEWFGTKGDGITDDTAALQAALNVARTATLPLQKTIKLNKKYLFRDTLTLYAYTTLLGSSFGERISLIADFDSNLKVALQSSNFTSLSYKDGMSRTQLDSNSRNYVENIRIENISLLGNKVTVEKDGVTTQRPIFCGIKIAGSKNSSIKNSRIRGFWYGVARFATWYASDEDIHISAYKIGYYAAYDMNNFSIRNGYINANEGQKNKLDFNADEEERFNTDPLGIASAGVCTVYGRGALYNVISEFANYARYYGTGSYVVDIHPWIESNDVAFGIVNNSNVSIIGGDYPTNKSFLYCRANADISLIGLNINGSINDETGNCTIHYFGKTNNNAQTISGLLSGATIYDKTSKRVSWWDNDKHIYTDANGFGIQDVWEGTYENRPKNPYIQPGAIYMKEEGDGTKRPIFQSQQSELAYGRFNINALGDTDGTITFTVGNTTFSFDYVASAYKNISELKVALVNDANSKGFKAWYHQSSNVIYLYNSYAGAIESNMISANMGNTNVRVLAVINDSYLGQDAVFVDALGGNAENDKKVSTLPATATDGDILFYTVIGKPVYYNNGHWYDFSDTEVTNPVEENEE